MQAHPLSTSAAREQIEALGPFLRHPAFPIQPIVVNAKPTPCPSQGIAQGSGLAHDAGNLLAALGLYSDLLARPGVLRPEHAHYAAELHDLAERGCRLMRRLIPQIQPSVLMDNVLDSKAAPAVTAVRPEVVVRDLEPLLSAIAAPHASVAVHFSRHLPWIHFAAEDLERILLNLVRNAAQAMEKSRRGSSRQLRSSAGRIRIALAQEEGHLKLSVEDDGPGMPVVAAAAFLSPSPLPSGASEGLGHRIIYELVTATGGTLSVRVRPGRGTSFLVKWPTGSAITSTIESPASLTDNVFQEVSAC